MSIRTQLKDLVEKVPAPLGRLLVHIPFSWRLGPVYGRSRREVRDEQSLSHEERRRYVFQRFQRIVRYAAKHNQFYQRFYGRHGFRIESLRDFDDIQRVPVVRKEDLRQAALEARSSPSRGRMLINTGGTSGEPLEFYLDRHAFAREWAHLHTIWEKLGYTPTDLKATFRGKNLGEQVVSYNPVHNEYMVSAYHGGEAIGRALAAVAERQTIRFLHGYPSAIYEFACQAQESAPELVEHLRASLQGILFGSEFPAPAYRNLIEEVFRVPTISWYGHSEMAVLAYERDEPFTYVPFHSYGFAEAVEGEHGHRLLATSYYNRVSPFIRYDTGDLIDPVVRGGILRKFSVAEGRTGDFIEDANGNRISLTALIFGRHHELFGRARFVQVRQPQPGQAVVLVTPAEPVADLDWAELFDVSSIAMSFEFRTLQEPVRTPAGKVPLLVRS